jgi:hypothetical protein
MNKTTEIGSWIALGKWMQSNDSHLESACQLAEAENAWFTQHNIRRALHAIAEDYLSEERLSTFLAAYDLSPTRNSCNVGIVSAGNVPLVGFHDVLCVLLTGYKAYLRLSSKDAHLMRAVLAYLESIDPGLAARVVLTENLKGLDAYIATGSNNSVRYFESYFGKYPHIIRRNRQSVAVLDGTESEEELHRLGEDVFSYFGMGCRNVSHLLVPGGYTFDTMLGLWQEAFSDIIMHNGYRNNYDYNYAIYLLNKSPFLMNGCVLLLESPALASRIACLNYSRMQNEVEAIHYLNSHKDNIQCVVSNQLFAGFKSIPFGRAQHPGLDDFADGIDTMRFLLNLSS